MKTMIVSAVLMVASFAHADGFECQVQDYDLNVKIYNHTNPNAGTRSAGVMILSDENVQFGNKTIARFDADAGTLSSSEVVYLAKVDLRFADISRKGELVLGTKLGELKTIKASIYHNYSQPVRKGEEIAGRIRWEKRNGQTGSAAMTCVRYLKN